MDIINVQRLKQAGWNRRPYVRGSKAAEIFYAKAVLIWESTWQVLLTHGQSDRGIEIEIEMLG